MSLAGLLLALPVAAQDMPEPPAQPPAPPVVTVPPPDARLGAIVLEGSLQTSTVDCAGRDVLIHAEEGHYELTGGCRSIWVQGRGNHVAAEIRPGARIVIGGGDVVVTYTQTAPGQPPRLSVTGSNSRAVPAGRLGNTPQDATPAP